MNNIDKLKAIQLVLNKFVWDSTTSAKEAVNEIRIIVAKK